jgi:hypothetical protein
MRVPRELWWIAGLTLLMLLLAALLRGGEAQEAAGGGVMPRRTTFSSAPGGLKALYLALDELGYAVQRLRSPLTRQGLPGTGTLVVVEPAGLRLTRTEWESLQEWAAQGNTLILAGEWWLPQVTTREWSDRSPWEPAPLTYATAAQPVYLAHGVEKMAVRSDVRIIREEGRAPERGAADEDEASETAEEEEWHAGPEVRPEEASEMLGQAAPAFADEQGTVVAYARVGQGRVVLMSSPWSLSNDGIGEPGNFAVFLNAVGPPDGGPVVFDEYHHGYGRNAAWQSIPLLAKLAIGQLLLALMLVMLAKSKRLGPVVPLAGGGRQRSEFLGTMTTVLHRGRATRLAVRTAYEAAVSALRAQTGAAAAEGAELADAVGRGNPEAREVVATALESARAALASEAEPSQAEAAAIIRDLDDALAASRRL